MLNVKKTLAIATFFFAFMPFFSFYPVSSDLQPIYLITAILLLIIDINSIKINIIQIVFLLIGIYSIFYIDTASPYFDPRKTFGLLMAFIIFHFFYKYNLAINQNILFTITLISFIALLIHYINPSFFIDTLGHFVRTIKIKSMGGARGASGFAAEPGFTGALSVFYFAVATYLKEIKNDSRHFYKITILCLLMLVLTRSGTGALLILLFLSLKYIKFNIKSVMLLATSLFIIYISSKYFNLGRAGYTVVYIFENPAYLISYDASIGQRVMNIVIGLLSVVEHPFGLGAGSYEAIAPLIIDKYNLSHYIAGTSGYVSAFAKYSAELGIVFWILIIILVYKCILRLGLKTAIPYIIMSLFFISASFSIAFPPTWYLLTLTRKQNKVVC